MHLAIVEFRARCVLAGIHVSESKSAIVVFLHGGLEVGDTLLCQADSLSDNVYEIAKWNRFS